MPLGAASWVSQLALQVYMEQAGGIQRSAT